TIELYYHCEGGCSYEQEDIDRMERFVRKYPDSERLPEAWEYLANMYAQLTDKNHEFSLANALIGLEYLQKIKARYPDYAQSTKFQTTYNQYVASYNFFWSLKLTFTKNKFNRTQPIIASLKLVNFNDSTQNFASQLGGGYPLIHVDAGYLYDNSCSKQIPAFTILRRYEEDEHIKAKYEPIPAKGSKIWSFDLRTVPHGSSRDYGIEGVYDFSVPGTYFVRVSMDQNDRAKIVSNEVQLVVE
ncbi:MAG: hypothetical protein ABIO24_04000, partial [Saprospiraceae bacterium]